MARYSDGLQRIINRDDLSLKTAGAETVSTTGDWVELGDKNTMYLNVDVTATSGTPTMTVAIWGSDDLINEFLLGIIGSDGYRVGSVGTTPANITTTGDYRALLMAMRYVRYKSTIGGTTPSFTYSVGGNSA